MVFGTGFAGNSHGLADVLDGYIQATPGWSLHATVSASPPDRVYFSTGTSGGEDIYLRITAGVKDEMFTGDFLKDSILNGSTHSNSLVFRTYQYFGASATDGYGESGRLGPKVINVRGLGTTTMILGDWHNSRTGNMIWDLLNNNGDSPTSDHDTTNQGFHAFDGKKHLWSTVDDALWRYDINEQTYLQYATAPVPRVRGLTYARDPASGKKYLYGTTNSATSGNQFIRYDIDLNSWGFLSNTSWNSSGLSGGGAWDGYDTLYFNRGGNQTHFGYYKISTDTWTAGPVVTQPNNIGSNLIYVPKNAANGLTNSRLFYNRGDSVSSFYSLDVDSSGVPIGSWVARTSAPDILAAGAEMFYFGGDYIWMTHGGALPYKMSRYQISTNSWVQISTQGALYSQGGGAGMEPQYHYQYLPVDDEGGSTEYWFFGDADKISVVARCDTTDEYDFTYAGLITSYYPRTFATTTSGIAIGGNQAITVDDGSIFTAGQRVFVGDFTGGQPIAEVGFDQATRKFQPHEVTRISSVNGNVVGIAGLKHSYSAGSKIGVDLQPVGVTGHRSPIMHMNNHVNTKFDNASSGPVEREYSWFCPVSEELTDQSAEESRTGQYMLWPMVIRTQRDEHAGLEIRGQFKGVFIVGDSGTATVGDLVSFLGNNYMLFQFDGSFYNETRFLAFGPV